MNGGKGKTKIMSLMTKNIGIFLWESEIITEYRTAPHTPLSSATCVLDFYKKEGNPESLHYA